MEVLTITVFTITDEKEKENENKQSWNRKFTCSDMLSTEINR